jgi:hypothetical protein
MLLLNGDAATEDCRECNQQEQKRWIASFHDIPRDYLVTRRYFFGLGGPFHFSLSLILMCIEPGTSVPSLLRHGCRSKLRKMRICYGFDLKDV